ncbi:mechanosensitive ion channel family protein [Natronococcus sp. A-GB1]|uniref:mechanosensitive ion channel family protein n=1 Tax=Natronococcus sp. A-GB1 TaxID=3037648 RepID=UPI00241D0F9F|nr:mechanosensitive ion channel family protein [Natronococcus sp. A-GB1]MDG5761427.1 mechanosensitive ion channel family protein [Natronococcus sp. A-GB1]
MTETTGLDWLADIFQATPLRIAVTLVAIGALVAVVLSFQRLQERLEERIRPLYSDIVSTAVLVGTFLLALATIVGVWGQTDQLRFIATEYDIGGDAVARAVVTFVIAVSALIVTRVVHRLIDEVLGSASAVTDHQREVTHRLSQVIILSVSVIVILALWIDDLGGLLVGAGFLGIIIGMAAQQVLGTILAGFVLMFARPFEIGDWIEVEGDQGIVTDISIINTRIRSFDGEFIMIPNDVIASEVVTNRSKQGRLRVELDVGVDYAADVEEASELARETVTDLEKSIDAPSPQVVTKAFGDSSIVLGVRFWIDKPSAKRHVEARTAAINAIKAEFDDAGIKIPYPQRELSGRAETGGFRVADEGEPAAMTRTDREPTDDRRQTPPQEGE